MKKPLKDYFVPHAGNDFKPHSLQAAAMVGMVSLVLLSFAATNLQTLLWQSSEWLVSTVLPAVVVDLTNDERTEAELVELRRNSTLDAAAQLKAEHMAANEYFSHYSPDGVSPWYWFGEAEYNFVHAGENLAIHFTDSEEVVTAWMNSPSHRDNILNGKYREIGVGTAAGTYEGYNTVYVVQLFGSPAATQVTETEADPAPAVAAAETSDNTETEPVDVLAESVAITEQIDRIEVTPEPIDRDVPFRPAPVEESDPEVVEATEDSVVIVLEHMSTSTGGIPATIDTETPVSTESTFMGTVATQPHFVLQLLYGAIAAFIALCLMLSIFIEIRRQHPIQIAYSVALLLLMYGLLTVHTWLSGGALIV